MRRRNVRVHVLDIDIAKGERGKCDNCPIAIAINRHLGNEWEAVIFGGHGGHGCAVVHRVDCSEEHGFEAPPSIDEFIKDFDWECRSNPRPFFFDIELPVAVLA